MMIIYKTTNRLNGKFYIGQDSKNDPDYLGSGVLLIAAIKKYGKENFVKEVLETCQSKQQLNEREHFWIEETKAKEVGYNIADGGHGGHTYTDATKQRISDRFKGKSVSKETIEKRRRTREERLKIDPDAYKHTPEIRKKIGEKSKGRIPSEYNRKMSSIKNSGENNPNYGKSLPWSEERKQSARGRRLSDEHRKKISDGNKGKKMGDDFRRKLSDRMKGENNPMRGKKKPRSDEFKQSMKGAGNPFYGRTHSDESKDKMRKSRMDETPEQKLERYSRFILSRTGKEPTPDQLLNKLEEYRKC